MEYVALRKESVDRNCTVSKVCLRQTLSLSARRAWIEIAVLDLIPLTDPVALRKESVDRNDNGNAVAVSDLESLSARRAWIEIIKKGRARRPGQSRSPQGERG